MIFKSLVVLADEVYILEPKELHLGAVDELLPLDEGILFACLAYAIGFIAPPDLGGPL